MKDHSISLANTFLFSGMEGAEIRKLLTCLGAQERAYCKDDYLLHAGDASAELGLLLSGSLLVIQEDFWGNRNLMARIMPGQLFAESFACSPGVPLGVSVVAMEESRVVWMNVQRILTTCPTACPCHSDVIRRLLMALAEKNLRFNEKLTHMSQRTTRGKLTSYLSAQAQKQGSPSFDIPFSRQELADYLGVERSAMSAELGRLRDDGVLSFQRNHFVLHTLSHLY